MENLVQGDVALWSSGAATIAIGAGIVALAALALLHVLSPEFNPSWRMVSEYANGRFSLVLSVMFVAWAIAALALALALLPLWNTGLGKVGLAFLVLAGIGPFMAAFFDVNHRLHGLATLVGIPTLSVAAILLTVAIRRTGSDMSWMPMWPAHLTWLSILVMGVAMVLLLSGLKRAGVDISGSSGPLAALPDGTIAVVGWANRLLVLAHVGWIIFAASVVLRFLDKPGGT